MKHDPERHTVWFDILGDTQRAVEYVREDLYLALLERNRALEAVVARAREVNLRLYDVSARKNLWCALSTLDAETARASREVRP